MAAAVAIGWLAAALLFNEYHEEQLSAEGKTQSSDQKIKSDASSNKRRESDEIKVTTPMSDSRQMYASRFDVARFLSIPQEEQLEVIRSFGTEYRSNKDENVRAEILESLRKIKNSAAISETRRAATLEFSRLGYFPGTRSILKSGYDSGTINADEYFGDLAHLSLAAPASERKSLLETIAGSNNSYSKEILSNIISQQPPDQELRSMNSTLKLAINSSPPSFEKGTTDFGMFDAIRYDTWLRANAALIADDSKAQAQYILNSLSGPTVDPRNIISVLSSPESMKILKESGHTSEVENLYSRSLEYAKRNSQTPSLLQAANMAGDMLRR